MNLIEYQEKSKRTCASLGTQELDLSHMVLGIMSELSELENAINKNDKVNIGEECADICFYVVNTFTFLNKNILDEPILIDSEYKNSLLELYKTTSLLSDNVKKFVAYKKELDTIKVQGYLLVIVGIINIILNNFNIKLKTVLQNNVDKLLVRYPLEEGFSEERANNRDLDKEYKELWKN